MHRTIEITVSAAIINGLLSNLLTEEHAVGVTCQCGVSVQPAGCDVVSV